MCEASVRGAMDKVSEVTNLKTDIKGRACNFRVPNDYDIESRLTEIAKSNSHVEGWELAK